MYVSGVIGSMQSMRVVHASGDLGGRFKPTQLYQLCFVEGAGQNSSIINYYPYNKVEMSPVILQLLVK